MKIKAAITACIFAICSCANAETPAHIGKYETHPADVQAIQKVTEDFRAALLAKDAKKLSSLLLNSNILFTSPASPARVQKRIAEVNVHADGIGSGGAASFLDFIANAKVTLEERFYNIKVAQDGHVAWVMFDFEFIEDGKLDNYGVEVWQMLKTPDGSWKIFSVVWSSHPPPK